MEIAAMATSFVMSFLVPMLKKGADGFGADLETRAADAAANGVVKTVQRLWARIKGGSRSPDDQDIVALFERQPEVMQGALTKVIERQLEQDEGFRKDLLGLLEGEAVPGTANWKLAGEIVGVVDARGANISGGNTAGVIYNAGQAADRTTQE